MTAKDREEIAALLAARPPEKNHTDIIKLGGAAVAAILVSWAMNQSLYVHKIDTNTKDIAKHEERLDAIEKENIGFKKDVLNGINEATKRVEAGEAKSQETLGIVRELKGRMDQLEQGEKGKKS